MLLYKNDIKSNLIDKFINITIQIKYEIFEYDNDINKKILKSFENKPDLLIIRFDMKEQNLLLLKNIPKYPIYYKNTIYLTPILYEQINGFYIIDSNKTINNFIDKSLKILGGILIDKNYNHKYNNNVILNGFKDENSDFTKNWFVNKIPVWMTKNIEKNFRIKCARGPIRCQKCGI